MEAQKRLELYEKALIDYERKAKKDYIFYNSTNSYKIGYYYGFCWYFQYIHLVHLKDLTELYKPETECGGFYYNKHDKHPRIKALKKAIETVKKLIND